MDRDQDESIVVLGHVTGFLVPVLGPFMLFVLSRTRGKFVRAHLIVSLAISTAWLMAAIIVISLDVGQLTVDEQAISGAGLLGLLVVASLALVLVILNVQRAKQSRFPLGWTRPDHEQ